MVVQGDATRRSGHGTARACRYGRAGLRSGQSWRGVAIDAFLDGVIAALAVVAVVALATPGWP